MPINKQSDSTPDLKSHLYLEEVLGEKALTKVQKWNETTAKRLETDSRFESVEKKTLEIINSKEKIPYVSLFSKEVRNFWQNETHIRGILRTTSLESYLTDQPDWETILDLDNLAKSENKNWVYKGSDTLHSDSSKCLLRLSDGGKDASFIREFDISSKSFVKDGFITKESKGSGTWLDADTLLISVDFGEGSMTNSGYPMISKIWKRGTDIADATELMRGDKTDVMIAAYCLDLSNGSREIMVTKAMTFFTSETYWLPRNTLTPVKLPLPNKSQIHHEFKGQLLLTINEDWRGFKNGDLLSFSFDKFMDTNEIEMLNLVYSPNERSSLGSIGITKSKLLISTLENVVSKAYSLDWNGEDWTSKILSFPISGTINIGQTDRKKDEAFINTEGFLSPSTLWLYNTATQKKRQAKVLPEWFNASTMLVEQFEALSSDGTLIPYFVVRTKDCKFDSKNPTLLYGYGGFEISLTPSYSPINGKIWLEQGGVYVLANIRGGGEFGPKWHQAGLKGNRQRVYDDFVAVAEDLIDKQITSPQHLGIQGASNGGLMVGVIFTQRPDLFAAVVCQVPLLDMLRFHKLLAGASWVEEYGDPEDETESEFLHSISPYHNIKEGTDYPEIFFYTSTKDDRVHPGHARKMAARLEDLEYDFLYYENIDGGHSASANLIEIAKQQALIYTFLFQKLKV